MRIVRHPFVERDLIGIVDHIVTITDGGRAAASRRLDEIDALVDSIPENPGSGVRLRGPLDGWLARHGGSGRRLTIVFGPDLDNDRVYRAMVAIGGRDWMKAAIGRQAFAD